MEQAFHHTILVVAPFLEHAAIVDVYERYSRLPLMEDLKKEESKKRKGKKKLVHRKVNIFVQVTYTHKPKCDTCQNLVV